MINYIDANNPDKTDEAEQQFIKHFHIGVFFDGTSNNMVQQAHYHTYNQKKPLKNKQYSDPKNGTPDQVDSYDDIQNKISELEKAQKELKRLKADYSSKITAVHEDARIYEKSIYSVLSVEEQRQIISNAYLPKIERKNQEVTNLFEDLERLQSQAVIDTNTMHDDTEKSYSNVAILHSLLNKQQNTAETYYFNVYVEGSGAESIGIKYGLKQNIIGLGFGFGPTGVATLVGKAVKHIHDYLSSLSSRINESTYFHFYVFGFSRGSTCARLFTQLTARDASSKPLPRENEFLQEFNTARSLVKNGRLPFMEHNFLNPGGAGTGIINRSNVKVEFLGIYDTVASIGFLQQKDGWVNSLKDLLENTDLVPPECKDIYHYLNAYDYGLYIPKTKSMGYVLHICAGDEFRENFALVNIGSFIGNGKEIIIPGCHSDVGGSYVDGINRERVLYNFIPRKNAETIKNGAKAVNATADFVETLTNDSIAVKATALGVKYISKSIIDNKILSSLSEIGSKRWFGSQNNESAYMFVSNPWTQSSTSDSQNLRPIVDALPQLGWVDLKWGEEQYCQFYDENNNPQRTTLKCKKNDDELKFTGYRLGEYSTISLKMMLTAVKGPHNEGFKSLFRDDFAPYAIPSELQGLAEQMVKEVSSADKRVWLVPEGGYSGDFYRNLRRKYLHFTSSCQLTADYSKSRLKTLLTLDFSDGMDIADFFGIDGANFGNECNYDDNARICRILYSGDDTPPGSCSEGVNYMYSFPGESFKVKIINAGQPPMVSLVDSEKKKKEDQKNLKKNITNKV